jgi:peptide/nickel transport system permease protein
VTALASDGSGTVSVAVDDRMSETAAGAPGGRRATGLRAALRSLGRDRGAVLGLFLVLVWLGVGLVGPFVIPGDPNRQELADALRPPAWLEGGVREQPLGTDHLGRDILVRIVYGARTSMLVGVCAVTLAVVAGALAGLFAAEWGGAVDEVLMRVADIQLSIPFILLAITVLALLGGSMGSMVLVLVLAGWVIYARVLRSELLYLREVEFVQSTRALGASRLRIIFRHLLPNTAGMVVVVATLELANVIILEAALSFLGVGIGPPEVSWGTMLADGRDYLTTEWWISTLPGIAIAVTILGVNLVGDWVRDVLDPRAART